METEHTFAAHSVSRTRLLVLFAMMAIAAILTAITAEYPSQGSWQLPAICLGIYAIAFFLVAIAPPGVGGGFTIATSALLAAGCGLLAFELWALAQGEVSTARDRQTVWLGAAACLANLSVLIAALRYILALRRRVKWWHVVLGIAVSVPPAWILVSRLV